MPKAWMAQIGQGQSEVLRATSAQSRQGVMPWLVPYDALDPIVRTRSLAGLRVVVADEQHEPNHDNGSRHDGYPYYESLRFHWSRNLTRILRTQVVDCLPSELLGLGR